MANARIFLRQLNGGRGKSPVYGKDEDALTSAALCRERADQQKN